MRILITGGAGFVGAAIGEYFKEEDRRHEIVALDNLKRRGSELNLPRLEALGIRFVHGDVRNPTDFEELQGNFDLIVDASAEAIFDYLSQRAMHP